MSVNRATLMDSTKNLTKRSSITVKPVNSENDIKFLVNFVITTYLGPDIKSDIQKSSMIQRIMANYPPYTLSDLGPSYVSISFLEKLYYSLLKNTSPNLVLSPEMFHMYLKGTLPSNNFPRQFTAHFPLELHQQRWYPESFRIIKGVVLIDNPSTLCIKEDDMSRFKFLTGVQSFKLSPSECLFSELVCPSSKESDGNLVNNVLEATTSNAGSQSGKFQQEEKGKRKCVDNNDGPIWMPLLSSTDPDYCHQVSSLVLTGTARRAPLGPPVGVVDIGTSKASYLFRVSLPGVKKDCSQFSCDIESSGRVHIKGVVNGGQTITRQSRVFQMKFRQLCAPGPFTLSFCLPGPVDPRLFAPNFRSDGIFEGVVIKQ